MTNSIAPAIISQTYEDDGTPEGIHISTLGCTITAVYVDPEHNACLLVLPGMSCTNKNGAIDLAKTLLPSVNIIATCNEMGWDTSYQSDETRGLDIWESRIMKKEDSDPQEVAGTLMSSEHCLITQEKIIESLTATGKYALRPDFFDGFQESQHNVNHVHYPSTKR